MIQFPKKQMKVRILAANTERSLRRAKLAVGSHLWLCHMRSGRLHDGVTRFRQALLIFNILIFCQPATETNKKFYVKIGLSWGQGVLWRSGTFPGWYSLPDWTPYTQRYVMRHIRNPGFPIWVKMGEQGEFAHSKIFSGSPPCVHTLISQKIFDKIKKKAC